VGTLLAVPHVARAEGQWTLAEAGTTCFNLLVDSPVEGPAIKAIRQPLQEVAGEREILYSPGDDAGLTVGDRMQVVRNTGTVGHPANGGSAGHVLEVLGIVEVRDVNANSALLEVVGACQEFEIGDVLRPLPDEGDLPQEMPRMPVFDADHLVDPADADAFLVMGAVESVLSSAQDPRRTAITQYTIYAQRDLMVMDQGANDSWQVGDVALVYRDRIYADSDLLRSALVEPPLLGRGVVVRADSSSAVVQLVDSVSEIQIGDRARKIGTVWDYVNHPPTISCGSERSTVRSGESVRLTATVSDTDGDATTVTWRSGSGTLSSREGTAVTWTASGLTQADINRGSVDVVATVDDGRDDGMVSCTVPLTLAPAPAAGGAAPGAMAGAEVLDFVCPEYPAGVTDADNRCKAVLDDVALRLRQDPRATAEIVGHSDSSGSDEINAQTSRERAEKALDYLVQTHGIDAARITVSGAGSVDPIADNDTPEGRLTNRRVAIKVTIPGE
jgi:outer membrane protein OmpA-like peptidoglycan-associated protein